MDRLAKEKEKDVRGNQEADRNTKPTSAENASGDTITNDRTSSVVSGLSVNTGVETTDGDTITNDGNSSAVLGVSMNAGVETANGETATNDGNCHCQGRSPTDARSVSYRVRGYGVGTSARLSLERGALP